MIKKLIYIIILFIILTVPVFAKVQKASVKYEDAQYAFKSGDEGKFLKRADDNMELYEKSILEMDRNYYLEQAMRYYFLVDKVNKSSIDAQIGLGRVYDAMNQDKLAKKCFFRAYNFDKNNPKLNLYIANYYYKRNDLVEAFHYYDIAYKHGFSNNYYLNYRMGLLHEKLADLETAKNFYLKAYNLNTKALDLAGKIRSLDKVNYSQSQYYLFHK